MFKDVKFTNFTVKCEGQTYTYRLQENVSLKAGYLKDEIIFQDGKWKKWEKDIPHTLMAHDYGGFVRCKSGLFGLGNKQPVFEVSREYLKALQAVADNDGNASNITAEDVEAAREMFSNAQLRDDFAGHDVTVVKGSGSQGTGIGSYAGINKLQVDVIEGTNPQAKDKNRSIFWICNYNK